MATAVKHVSCMKDGVLRTLRHVKHLLRPREPEEYMNMSINSILALHESVDYLDKIKKVLMDPIFAKEMPWIVNDFPKETTTLLQYFTLYHHPESPYKSDQSVSNYNMVRTHYFPSLHGMPPVISHYVYTKSLLNLPRSL